VSTNPERQYDTEAVFLDGLYEFHPEAFEQLEPQDLEVLQRYYLVGEADIPPDVHARLQEIRSIDPQIEEKASRALANLLRVVGAEH
jgi:hypothetical protein